MLRFYIKGREAVARLIADRDGVVSFEYLIVAACIIAAVSLAFTGAGAGTIGGALKTGITSISTALSAAITGA